MTARLSRPLQTALGMAALATAWMWIGLALLLFYFCATGAVVALSAEAGIRGPRAVATYATALDAGSCAGPLLAWTMPEFALPTEWIFSLVAAFYMAAGGVALRSCGRSD